MKISVRQAVLKQLGPLVSVFGGNTSSEAVSAGCFPELCGVLEGDGRYPVGVVLVLVVERGLSVVEGGLRAMGYSVKHSNCSVINGKQLKNSKWDPGLNK